MASDRTAAHLPQLRRNLAAVRTRIEAARARAGARAAAGVDLLVVTKSAPVSLYPLLLEAGVTEVAENRVQAVEQRRPLAPPSWRWHGIGHLQRNKVKRAVRLFDVFHALDSLELARALDAVLAGAGRTWAVYIQVNAADDPRKGGVAPSEAGAFVQSLRELPHLMPVGFMTMARLGADEASARAAFRTLREVRDDACRSGALPEPPRGLSMGMSGDYELAVEEGATVVRVGSAVFEGLDLETAPAGGRADAEPEERT